MDSLNASRLLWQTTVSYHLLPGKARTLKRAHALHNFLSSLSNSPSNPILFCQLTLIECLQYGSVLHGRLWFVVMYCLGTDIVRNICNNDYGKSWIVQNHLLCSIFSEKTTHSWLMMEQPPRCCVPMGTPSRLAGGDVMLYTSEVQGFSQDNCVFVVHRFIVTDRFSTLEMPLLCLGI